MSDEGGANPLCSSPEETKRWDLEWIHYFQTENTGSHFATPDQFEVPAGIGSFTALDVHEAVLEKHGDPNRGGLRVWVPGDELAGKRVLEIGCGCGYLGKQLGLFCELYVGIDHSQLALNVARLTSTDKCVYLHASQMQEIGRFAGSMDTMVGRYFFIHQNWTRANQALSLAASLLKHGGKVRADFFLVVPGGEGLVYPARHEIDQANPSCAFAFERADIAELAEQRGFAVESVEDKPLVRRRFVCLRRRRR